jgi:hypothetical protein
MVGMKNQYRLRISSAERMAVELDDRGEKHAALTIAGLLAIIEEYQRTHEEAE